MAALSDYLEDALLDHILGTAALAAPTPHLALFTADPTDAGTGAEVSGSGYARQASTWGAAADGSASNSSEHSFTAAGGNFGTVSHWALYDAATAGNMLIHGAFGTAREFLDGDTVTVAAGALTVTAD